jgi:hypothetical protein
LSHSSSSENFIILCLGVDLDWVKSDLWLACTYIFVSSSRFGRFSYYYFFE